MTTADRAPAYDVVWPLAPSAAAPTALASRSPDLAGNNHIQGGRVSKRVTMGRRAAPDL